MTYDIMTYDIMTYDIMTYDIVKYEISFNLHVLFQDLASTCYFDALFVHKDAKPFPYNNPYLAKSFRYNSHVDDENNI